MKYKYTRKQLSQAYGGYDHDEDFIEDLLAQKEDRKECKCKKPNYKTVITAYGFNKLMCIKCGKELPTPSPLEIEEIEVTSQIDLKDVHKLIRNQKKLYQHIKEKI